MESMMSDLSVYESDSSPHCSWFGSCSGHGHNAAPDKINTEKTKQERIEWEKRVDEYQLKRQMENDLEEKKHASSRLDKLRRVNNIS